MILNMIVIINMKIAAYSIQVNIKIAYFMMCNAIEDSHKNASLGYKQEKRKFFALILRNFVQIFKSS